MKNLIRSREEQIRKQKAGIAKKTHEIASLMYRSNRSLNPPPPGGITRAFDVFSCPGGGNLINLVFPGACIWSLLIGGGEFDR